MKDFAMSNVLLRVEGLKTHFPIREGLFKRQVGSIRAVDGVNLTMRKGETLALVGESGCGKTTVGKSILRLIEPTEGSILYGKEQTDVRGRSFKELRALRRELQIVFQDPYGSMNPRMTVGSIVAEGPRSFGLAKDRADLNALVDEALASVQLPSTVKSRYPHEFSGGQRQRICIARALAVRPRFLVLDEAVSALDVSIRAQIINLLRQLQRERDLAYLLITHDLSVVQFLADRVSVMYLGQIVEEGDAETLFQEPGHPYTRALMAAIPSLDPDKRTGVAPILGDVPSPAHPPQGCRFHPRCPHVMDRCREEPPPPYRSRSGTQARCFLCEGMGGG